MVTLATWNVNSIKTRLGHLSQWVTQAQPDILFLQELKCETDAFPRLEVEALGYKVYHVGQKSYNGVALLSKQPLEVRLERLPGEDEDAQARYIEARLGDLTLGCLYLPNGNPVESEKYGYKLRWMARLEARARALLAEEKPFVLGGDFNIIPQDEDVYAPEAWAHDALFKLESREAWRRICNLGLTEAFRALHPDEAQAYTFWDYQAGAWPQDKGLRIDHFLLSPEAVSRLEDCVIDKTPRGWEKASDHTPVMLRMAD